MDIILKGSYLQFKNPNKCEPTKRIPEHYYGRRVDVIVNNQPDTVYLSKSEIPFDATNEDILKAVERKLKLS